MEGVVRRALSRRYRRRRHGRDSRLHIHLPRGVVHRNQNVSDKPARTVELVIVDKDKPRTEQVPD
jgi:hypothetical protein